MLRVDPIRALAALRFEGLDGVSGLLHGAGHEPADGVLLPAHLVHDLGQRSAVLALELGNDLSGLATFARSGGVLRLGGRALGARAAPLALRSAFGFAGSTSGWAASLSLWIRSQMRLAAVFALLNPFTGSTPGRLFHMATKRSAGQLAISSASSFSLAKVSNGVVVVARLPLLCQTR